MPDEELLAHMLDAAGRIQSYLTGITRDQFLQNRLRQDAAVIRCIQVIGEAARGIKRHAD
ncbi:MAG: DUF86 domain-containing protein [Chloroflexi bacterium]|nr:DUF86 domain-containing protein [Chloroflexota bacterium]